MLADATSDPDFRTPRELDWTPEDGLSLPLFMPRKEELVGSLKDSAQLAKEREQEEHWRLLYVALTRAEEHLFVGGALKPRQQKAGMGENCWHVQIDRAMTAMGIADADGMRVLVQSEEEPKKGMSDEPSGTARESLPAWLRNSAPEESRPPRPLAPSAILPIDATSEPPPSADMRKTAERGIVLHSLFERLPAVDPARRREVADRWLLGSAGIDDAAERERLIRDAMGVIDDPLFADIFSPHVLAEAPLAGVVDGTVIAGTVDRLLVSDEEVLVVDFKTGRRVPASVEMVSPHHKAQMAAYVAVLRSIFPRHAVRSALLYTSGPKLMYLSDDDLEPHKPGYRMQQDNLAEAG